MGEFDEFGVGGAPESGVALVVAVGAGGDVADLIELDDGVGAGVAPVVGLDGFVGGEVFAYEEVANLGGVEGAVAALAGVEDGVFGFAVAPKGFVAEEAVGEGETQLGEGGGGRDEGESGNGERGGEGVAHGGK